MKRTTTARLAGAALLIAAVGVAGTAIALRDDPVESTTATDVASETSSLNTAVVARKDLSTETELDGTLGFGDAEALPNLASGVVTWLPEPGTIVDFGEPLYEIDGRPVLLVEGTTPFHRVLNSRSADGPDVARLEQLLTDLGHANASTLTVDDDFTSKTSEAIERWEATLEVSETGAIGLGTLVVRPAPLRIASVNASLGQMVNGGSVLSVTDTERIVVVSLDTGLTGLLEEQQVVSVELPDGSTVAGTVVFVGDVAITEGQGQQQSSFLEVEIVLEGSGGTFDQSPVTVHVDEVLEADAVVVPISALLALAEGGYAVETVVDGRPRLVGVELQTFLDNEVSIGGELAPGDVVVVP